MKNLIYSVLFVLLIDITFQNCANPGAPTGGPKDTIPPTMTEANPINGTTNFSNNTIEIYFSEYISVEKLKQQLIITPSTDIQYKSIAKRNKLLIKLEGSLEDSTTYNFNFANGVTDITEKNPVVNLSLAFSTGPTIDSMSVSGYVEELLSKEPGKGYVVGLYLKTDSLNYFSDRPMYFTTANDSGQYRIDYIKRGVYKILAFSDDNGNFLLDPDLESHGFLEQDIYLDSAINLEPIRCLLQNVKPLALINARPVGRYVEIKFNKTVDSYNIQPSIPSNIIGEKSDIIRLYKPTPISYGDSTVSYIVARDSLGNQVSDSIKYVYIESNRKPATFSHSFDKSSLESGSFQNLTVFFDKPISVIDTTKVLIKSDSLITYSPRFTYTWNPNKTQLDIELNITDNLLDSLYQSIQPKDTISIDSIPSTSKVLQPSLSLYTEKGAFLSVENDTSSNKSVEIKKSTKKASGVLKVDLVTEETHFQFQLLNRNGDVVYTKTNSKRFTLPKVRAGEYQIRILIDSNQDGKWSFGNLLKNQEPEEVFIYEEKTSIRENWEVELSISF